MILLEASPKITDWIQSFGVLLGVPLVLWNIINLFRKNKAQEKKLQSLEDIVREQNEIVKQLKNQADQMIIQSGQMQYQSSLMNDSNKLLEKQIELQSNMFLHNQGIEEQKLSLERQRIMSKIKPYFVKQGSNSNADRFYANFTNKGKEAKNLTIQELDVSLVRLQIPKLNLRIDQGGAFNLEGTPRKDTGNISPEQVTYQIELQYQDAENNQYTQRVEKLRGGGYEVGEPILISES